MDDRDLDQLLDTGREHLGGRVEEAAGDLVGATRTAMRHDPGRWRQPTRPRRLRVWAGVAVAAVALTAGGSLAAVQLGAPPFQTLEPGVERIPTDIPVDYTEIGSSRIHCHAFLEFRRLSPDQTATVRRYLTARDWTGFGDAAYAAAQAQVPSGTVEQTASVFYGLVGDRLATEAQRALPGVRSGPDVVGPAFNGSSMSCDRPGTR